MEFKDYYKILGVDEAADDKAIKSAYRKLARQYHPDVSTENQAEEKFKEVTEAYEVLKSPEKRAEYDELRKYGQGGRFQPPPGWQSAGGGDGYYEGDFSEFFSSIFGNRGGDAGFGGFQRGAGGGRSYAIKGEDIETELPIFLEDTLSEESKTIEYHLPQVDAQGRRVKVAKTLKVKIPAGVSDGERIRLKNQGGPGYNGGANGDLYLRIRLVPHPLFDVQGHNLLVTVPIAPWEAVLGAKIVVPTLEGKVNITVPANSQAGQKLRIKGKGLQTKTGRADLFAVLKIVVPASSDAAAQAQWQALQEASQFNPRADWQ
ncbi:DnaJ C-terminal domain-containing protein [Halioxenophilus sp. WMMB6]|uniref:DnaJ C-terminal domain-containing protein n=1 Tax=Halioxenophilus sp. WMMB6 TaxID=3073815 RepID=UPI00295E6AF6|nr:DnaJ C-terminal domain-containing protein [Halioxenophilus sp. WMMB6]